MNQLDFRTALQVTKSLTDSHTRTWDNIWQFMVLFSSYYHFLCFFLPFFVYSIYSAPVPPFLHFYSPAMSMSSLPLSTKQLLLYFAPLIVFDFVIVFVIAFVFVFVFVFAFLLVRSYVLSTLIKCLKGHKSLVSLFGSVL